MAIEKCVNEDVLKDFLSSHGSEVFNMLLTEFNMEDALAVAKEEGEARGEARGIGIGMEKVFDLLERGFSLQEAKKRLFANF